MIKALFAAHALRWAEYEGPLRDAFASTGLSVDLAREFDPASVDYIIYAPNSPLQDFRPYSRTKAVLNLWAGVEDIVGHVLRHHLNIDHALAHQSGAWVRHIPPLARQRNVGVLGLGELGAASATALAALNFNVFGWSRGAKFIDSVTCLTGWQGLEDILSKSEILILLLPLTRLTRNVINADALARMPRGAVILNPGRGPLIDDDALLNALDSGQVGHATLDVFRTEPLPADHPYWTHPRVTVTPHIASETRAVTASRTIAENIRRSEAGEPLLHLVDRDAGY